MMAQTLVGAQWRANAWARVALVIAFILLVIGLALFFEPWRTSAGFLALGFLKFNRKALLLKAEVTYGTDAVPTGAANAMLAYDGAVRPLQLQTDHREFALPHFGNQGDLVAGKNVLMTFKVPMSGAGAAGTAPAYGPALIGCGLAETLSGGVSATYAPTTRAVGADTSVDIYFFIDGRRHSITGAIGDVKACLPAGRKPYFEFSFIGLYNIPTDVALPAMTLTAFQKELIVNNANTTPETLFTFAAKFRLAEIMLGNKLDYRNLVNSEAVRLLDRQSSARFQFEDELIATKDYWTPIMAETSGAFTVTHGTVAGNKVTIAAGQVQLLEPSIDNEGGVAMMTLGANLKPTSAGNDELSIVVL